jgi:ElaB/YqjD/DUF883 family membrane-anchored ribosome-binding protein
MAREGEAQNGHQRLAGGDGFSLQANELRRRLDSASRELTAFVRQHPLECLGGALVVGFVVGRLVSRRY